MACKLAQIGPTSVTLSKPFDRATKNSKVWTGMLRDEAWSAEVRCTDANVPPNCADFVHVASMFTHRAVV